MRSRVRSNVVNALLDLADRDPMLFVKVLQQYLDTGNVLQLGPWGLAAKLIEVCGSDQAYEIISSADNPQRNSWLFGYFISLPQESITGTTLQQLYLLYEAAKPEEVPRGIDHLVKFQAIDNDVIVKITRTLVDRCKTESKFGSALSGLFTERAEAGHKLQLLFAADVDLLKEAYFAGSEVDDHEDFEGEFFNQLLDLDPIFGSEWVSQLYQRVDRPSWRDDSRDYAFIWRRNDFITVMEQIVDAVTMYGKNRLIYDSYLQRFFLLHEGTADIVDLDKHQDEFLDDMIRRRHNEKDLMMVLFEVISGFSPERRRARLETFVLHNKDHEMFEHLPTQSSSITSIGSAVPGLQRRLEFFESLLPILGTVELLRHRQYVEQRIQRVRDQIVAEKRHDFMTDDY